MSMNPEQLREALIQAGISPAELDDIKEPEVLRHLGKAMISSYENDRHIGNTLTFLIGRLASLEARIKTLEAK